MRKLKLDMEALRVESFTTARAQARAGTVHARSGDLSDYQSCGCPWIDLTTACPLPTDDCSDDPSCDVCVTDRCAGETEPGQRVCMA
jgi:hypothetical protein